jgi:hypothetical protein
MRTEKYWVRGIHKVHVINGKIQYLICIISLYSTDVCILMKICFGWDKVLGTKLLDNTDYCENLPLNQRCPTFSGKNATTINPMTPKWQYRTANL